MAELVRLVGFDNAALREYLWSKEQIRCDLGVGWKQLDELIESGAVPKPELDGTGRLYWFDDEMPADLIKNPSPQSRERVQRKPVHNKIRQWPGITRAACPGALTATLRSIAGSATRR